MNDREPLAPEERALQRQLSRLGAGAEPSAALDARILAAAGAKPAPGSRHAHGRGVGRRPKRWPVGGGLAASLVLAAGVAWQLRPLPDTEVQYSEAPAAVAMPVPPQREGDSAVVAQDASEAISESAGDPAPPVEPRPAPAMEIAPRRAEPDDEDVATDAARRADAAASQAARPAPPPPPPPPAPAAPSAFPSTAPVSPAPDPRTTGAAGNLAGGEPAARAGEAAAAREDAMEGKTLPGKQSTELERIETTGSRVRQGPVVEEPDAIFDEAPPASVDSPTVRAAWLARIRELRADGEIEAARESLREFHRRYPRVEVPADLRPLLD
ncbi:hypothetical protein [Luteimonas vadosa]|uniref:Uncharacterized protein n=1 Tax=Luteimonas vadosa TaxID=1165507 RepID=A0ABP9E4B4_9GAMM